MILFNISHDLFHHGSVFWIYKDQLGWQLLTFGSLGAWISQDLRGVSANKHLSLVDVYGFSKCFARIHHFYSEFGISSFQGVHVGQTFANMERETERVAPPPFTQFSCTWMLRWQTLRNGPLKGCNIFPVGHATPSWKTWRPKTSGHGDWLPDPQRAWRNDSFDKAGAGRSLCSRSCVAFWLENISGPQSS